MKKLACVSMATAAVLSASLWLGAEEMPPMPKPTAEHEWLKQLVGEWNVTSEITMEEGQPPMTCTGTETVRMIGGFWIVGESQSTIMDMPMTGLLTLGYDVEKKKYVGTWVGSMDGHLWTYEGTVDDSGKKLTLLTEGPCPNAPGTHSKFRETIEITDKDHRTFTSRMQQENGSWATIVKVDYERKV